MGSLYDLSHTMTCRAVFYLQPFLNYAPRLTDPIFPAHICNESLPLFTAFFRIGRKSLVNTFQKLLVVCGNPNITSEIIDFRDRNGNDWFARRQVFAQLQRI